MFAENQNIGSLSNCSLSFHANFGKMKSRIDENKSLGSKYEVINQNAVSCKRIH